MKNKITLICIAFLFLSACGKKKDGVIPQDKSNTQLNDQDRVPPKNPDPNLAVNPDPTPTPDPIPDPTPVPEPTPTPVVSKKIAITIDDLPMVADEFFSIQDQADIYSNVLDALAKHKVTATGFAVGSMIEPAQEALLQEFVNAGHKIDNHSFSHADVNSVDVAAFIQEIELGAQAISSWQTGQKFFRYPYLSMGLTAEKRTAIEDYLTTHDYKVAHATIDTSDYNFNTQFIAALKENNIPAAELVGQNYLDHVKAETQYYVNLANDRLDRSMNHVLLVHMNRLNSAFLEPLLANLEEAGFEFVTLEEALQDPVYQMKDGYLGEGTTWLDMLFPAIVPEPAPEPTPEAAPPLANLFPAFSFYSTRHLLA